MGMLGIVTMLASAEADSGGGIFTGGWGESIWTIAAFLILVVVLRKYAWNRILEGLQARQDHIKRQLEAADGARQEAQQALDGVRQQSDRILKKAGDEAHKKHEQMLDQARQEVLAVKQQAQTEIQHARAAAQEKMWGQATELVAQLTGEVLGRAVTDQDNERLLQEAIKTLKAQTTS